MDRFLLPFILITVLSITLLLAHLAEAEFYDMRFNSISNRFNNIEERVKELEEEKTLQLEELSIDTTLESLEDDYGF